MKWLLVENDRDILNVISYMILAWGREPLVFSGGRAAWVWLDAVESGDYTDELPELALLDLRLSGYTGDAIAARIRSLDKLKDIPIALMTAYSFSEDERWALSERSGVDSVLEKPLPDMDELKRILFALLKRRGQGEASDDRQA